MQQSKKARLRARFVQSTFLGGKKTPQRRCVGCREMKDKPQVMRIVCNADGNISIDETGKAHGRGAYVCKNGDCLKKAQKSKGLERSLKRAVPQEIYETLTNVISMER